MDTAEENTWRAFKGEALLMAWPCRFKWHKWTVWIEEEPHKFAGETYIRSSRFCAGCNKREVQVLKMPSY